MARESLVLVRRMTTIKLVLETNDWMVSLGFFRRIDFLSIFEPIFWHLILSYMARNIRYELLCVWQVPWCIPQRPLCISRSIYSNRLVQHIWARNEQMSFFFYLTFLSRAQTIWLSLCMHPSMICTYWWLWQCCWYLE